MDAGDTTYLLNAFIEAIARITSYALTDREKESVVHGFRQFHERLERIKSSSSLRQLAIESKRRQSEGAGATCHHEGKTCTQNAIRGSLKAFAVGYAVKYALDVAPHMISLRLFSKPSLLLRAFSRDTVSFAVFLSAAIGSYKAFLCAMRHLFRGSDYTNSLVAGVLSGFVAIKLDRNRSRRVAITLYMASRALQYGCVWLVDRWQASLQRQEDHIHGMSLKRSQSAADVDKPREYSAHTRKLQMSSASPSPSPSTSTSPPLPAQRVKWSADAVDNSVDAKREMRRIGLLKRLISITRKCAPTALMSASCAAIVYVLVFHTKVLPRGYMTFLGKASGYDTIYPRKTASAMASVGQEVLYGRNRGAIPRGMTTKEYLATLPLASDIVPAAKDGTLRHNFVACGIFHPHTTSCVHGVLSTALASFPYAFKVYAPLNAAVLLIFKRAKLFRDPQHALLSLAKSSARSSLFFTLIVLGIVNGSCVVRSLLGRDSFYGYLVTGAVGGLTVLVEAPSRRVELAMYCFLRAIENIWDVGIKRKWWKNIRHAEVAIFSAAMGVMMTIYQNDPTTIGITYHSILTRIFGRN
ncbi:hypothetical protein IW140_004866 [Coemansia sp. RSA 1813]|nr:hypothetical protein EV178_002254 [Coemansia sp. RSA 1646]KAJ1770197.1 hypothetical protein LPJ74_003420 [Coemansia sp. RSA 1843]KAJ2090014.1 hypothetical protein IW138_002983 [Coemansia sp. RSA 986]KAJ2217025.1 hypothetical protein EV179_000792 [Coemansia sp. RSA 487]KAJ2566540.1 hypothetical protein IW140_004866 [Coemansia sp. RSA 1813]